MTYTGLELFTDKLNHLIYPNDNPFINSYLSILTKRPQLQLLYKELKSMIQIMFVDPDHELEEVRNLKKRFKDAVQEAHAIIDLFVFYINCGKNKTPPTKSSLNLKKVMTSINSIKVTINSHQPKSCHELPLAENVDQNGLLETLALSFYHLPPHLRDCFLYLCSFPKNYKFRV